MLLLDHSSCYDMTGYLSNITLLSCYPLTPGMVYLTLVIITITGMMT